MKTKLLLILIFCTIILSAQEKQITKLLNEQLRKEIKHYPGVGDSLKLINPFSIDENKVLRFQVSKYNFETEETEFITQEVSLDKVTGFVKDINIIFETEKDAVKVTTIKTDVKGQEISNQIYNYHLFFTEINKEKDNENLRDEILNAFSKAGYIIHSQFWAD
ncbi:hypothetical protein [Moheibacter sediminis]|uniref:DUF4468 domain-containing protein n=1 Tax=Moheibacter sediminis TaxID=1434700 RepID=A0A1W2D2T8_9FLAO|nr:hypothetical protein [Moheibacter sediminis]SMC91476.1 hypothetical protein SAMN06296427_1145 [Moheibacter sediminis]